MCTSWMLYSIKHWSLHSQEMDIDEILSRAETQEVTEEGSVGNDLLSQFKMANFAIDEKELGGSQPDNRRMSTSAEGTCGTCTCMCIPIAVIHVRCTCLHVC